MCLASPECDDQHDKDWQAILLRKRGGVYTTYQLQASLPSQDTARETLFQLFSLENEDFSQFMSKTNVECMRNTGRTVEEIILDTDQQFGRNEQNAVPEQ
jgi:hypothetical protein